MVLQQRGFVNFCSYCMGPVPGCTPETTSLIRCRSLPGSRMGCLCVTLRYWSPQRMGPYQSSAGSFSGVRSHSWGRRRAACQGQVRQASSVEHLDSLSGSYLVIVFQLDVNLFLCVHNRGFSNWCLLDLKDYLAVAGEQECLAESCLGLDRGSLASSSSHLASFHSASSHSLPEHTDV